jgi:putative serine protease PepD
METDPDPRPVRGGLRHVLAVAVVAALLAGALGGALGYFVAVRMGVSAAPIGQPATNKNAQRPPDSLAGVAKKVLPGVVTVKVRSSGGVSLGSGFIASTDGYVVTNEHVVNGLTGSATVTFNDGNSRSASLVGSDQESDIAVLKVSGPGGRPVEFGDSDSVQVGDPVSAFGSPLNLPNTVTAGIVSAVDRPIEAAEQGAPTRYYAAIQTDAAINHGNSGGPLVDADGRVIGINAVIRSQSDNSEGAGNIGLAFAIPINQARRQVQEIITTGKVRRTVLGAELDNSFHSVDGGVKLTTVAASGPAAGAGLRPGDVVLSVSGVAVEDPGELVALVRKYAPGTAVTMKYQRSGGTQSAQVTLVADAK